ncbi:MAG: SpoIIIAH-like family protein [Blautia marasmi]
MVSMADLTEKSGSRTFWKPRFRKCDRKPCGETADVVVPEADLTDAKRAQIEDIVKEKQGLRRKIL